MGVRHIGVLLKKVIQIRYSCNQNLDAPKLGCHLSLNVKTFLVYKGTTKKINLKKNSGN